MNRRRWDWHQDALEHVDEALRGDGRSNCRAKLQLQLKVLCDMKISLGACLTGRPGLYYRVMPVEHDVFIHILFAKAEDAEDRLMGLFMAVTADEDLGPTARDTALRLAAKRLRRQVDDS